MLVGLRGDHRLLHARQELLRLGQRQPQMRDIAKVAGRPDLHDAIPGPGLSVSVSTNRKTHPIRDLPAGNGPTGHIACVLIPPLSGHSRQPSAKPLKSLDFLTVTFGTSGTRTPKSESDPN